MSYLLLAFGVYFVLALICTIVQIGLDWKEFIKRPKVILPKEVILTGDRKYKQAETIAKFEKSRIFAFLGLCFHFIFLYIRMVLIEFPRLPGVIIFRLKILFLRFKKC